MDQDNLAQVAFSKKEHAFIYSYGRGEEHRAIDCILEQARNPDLPLDGFDAAALAYRLLNTSIMDLENGISSARNSLKALKSAYDLYDFVTVSLNAEINDSRNVLLNISKSQVLIQEYEQLEKMISVLIDYFIPQHKQHTRRVAELCSNP